MSDHRAMREELSRLCDSMQVLADQMAMAGQVHASGVVLAGRQAIRVLATRYLTEPEQEEPRLQSVPPEATG